MDFCTVILAIFLIGLAWIYYYLTRNRYYMFCTFLKGITAVCLHFRGHLEQTNLPMVKPFFCFGSPPFMMHKILYHKWYQEKACGPCPAKNSQLFVYIFETLKVIVFILEKTNRYYLLLF